MRLRLGDDVPSLKKELVRLRFGEDVPDLKKEELL
jgi:ribosomal protein L29